MIATAPAPTRTHPPVSSRPLNPWRQRFAEAIRQPGVTELDARTPAPPKIIPAILTGLKALPPGQPQFVRTANAPVDLLRALEPKGVEAYPAEMPDGSWRTLLILGTAGRG